MSRSTARAAIAVALFAGACSQTPAPIELKGSNVYSKSSVGEPAVALSSYSPAAGKSYRSSVTYVSSYEPAPVVSQATQQTAAVQSIGVNDLAPPAHTTSRPVAVAKETPGVNPWTGRQRVSEDVPKPMAPTASAIKNNGKYQPVRLAGARDEKPTSFMWPVSGKKIISGFGPKGGGKVNDGINIASAGGEPVWASADGEVVYAGNELKGYGNMVIVKHAGDKTTTYAHLSDLTVDKYERVKQGDIIGYVGATGNVAKPQLHFAIRDGKEAVDPRKYLSQSMAGL